MMDQRLIKIAVIGYLIFSIVSCIKNDAPPCRGFIYRDIRDREVCIQAVAKRIVSLAPSNTEIIFALGKGDKLVGVTEQCDFPEQAKSIKKVGDFNRPNIELIIACEPDLILAGNQIPDQAIRVLESAGFTVVVTEALSFNNIFQTIEDIGRILKAEEKADTIIGSMQKKIKIITAKIGDAKPVTCYYMIACGEQGNWSAGRGSVIHELMELAGGYNIARDIPSPWGIFDLEMLLQKDPEVIFMGKTAGNLDSLSRLPLYKDLRAVKQGRVMVVDDDLVSRPGPRIVEGLALMAKTLHPERFP